MDHGASHAVEISCKQLLALGGPCNISSETKRPFGSVLLGPQYLSVPRPLGARGRFVWGQRALATLMIRFGDDEVQAAAAAVVLTVCVFICPSGRLSVESSARLAVRRAASGVGAQGGNG